ncbi:MAG TPA: cobyric acid synthase, partial [Thermodesulfobacteriota bacterium]|nr:cobyric acid synthase [Thermodesulfobacteriota bacterium]
MILGAGSDVGKSIMVAALCRIFRQEGISVAPFKAQNMALNSFITPEGGEMGRAQVVQAQAAGLTPQVDMNPILLKPCSDVGSQVIVHGRVYGNLAARESYEHKPRLVRKVMESYRRLAAAYDLIVLEGAGSAVELNLKQNDLVNFSMARRAGAAVLLVADIDRGGVFAATIGTYHLLTRAERRLLHGFIINKFRGDISLFDGGVRIIEERTKKRVLGVVPYLKDLVLPQEDSVALERKMGREEKSAKNVQIGVIRLPHISNYTDFDPLEHEPGVSVQYLDHHRDLKSLDVLILPGTKNTSGDLGYLQDTGLAGKIKNFAGAGGRVIGICGGFQMLGQWVRDPLGVEGNLPEAPGLGLLPIVTTMAGEKTTTQVKARFLGLENSRPAVLGYEIHMGQTEPVGEGQPVFRIESRLHEPVEMFDGWATPDFRIWGSYIHGLFDRDPFRQAWLADLRGKIGLAGEPGRDYTFEKFQEQQFDKLAEVVRKSLDVRFLMKLIIVGH